MAALRSRQQPPESDRKRQKLSEASGSVIVTIDDKVAQAYMKRIAEAGNDYGFLLGELPRTTGKITKHDQTQVG